MKMTHASCLLSQPTRKNTAIICLNEKEVKGCDEMTHPLEVKKQEEAIELLPDFL
jgi:hypothetical protein